MLAIVLIFLAALVAAELFARAKGLHRPLIYEATNYGYRVKPAQDLHRLGNRLYYNRFGMRSEEVEPTPPAGVTRILCIGDSVTYGGVQTDQTMTYTALLERKLREAGRAVEVLNISAGGWAPANEEGWLRANGLFGASTVVLQLGTHDLFQHPAPAEIVGVHPQFPDKPPVLGLQELLFRYVLPRVAAKLSIGDPGVWAEPPRTAADIDRIMRTIERIGDLVGSSGARLVVMLVEKPDGMDGSDELTLAAKRALEATLSARHVTLVRPYEALQAAGGRAVFRDEVHPDERGNAVIAEQLARAITAP